MGEPGTAVELPSYLQIEPVGQCNLRCQMCPIQFRRDGPPYGPVAFMPLEHFVRVLEQFPGLRELHLQGMGEPMMHPRLFDMIEYAATKGICVSTNTNLTLLSRRRAERCVTSGLARLHVSLDGATAETYEKIRIRARFQRVIGNLELLLETRRRLKSDRPHLHLVMVIMRQNLQELPELVRLAHRWSVEEVFVQYLCHDFAESSLPDEYRPMRQFVQEETLLEVPQERIKRYFSEARRVARELSVRLRLPRPRPKLHAPGTPGPERCDWPWQRAYISYQGYAMPCCIASTPDRIHFGNVLEEGVDAVWSGAGYQAFRRQLASDTPPEICRSCSVYQGTF